MKPIKKPYVKPEIKSEAVFEKASLACGKCSPTSLPIWRSQCSAVKRKS